MSRPTVVLPPTNEPHRLAFLAVSLSSGVYLLAFPPPASVAASYPDWVVPALAVGLGLSGAMGLVAVWWARRNPVSSLRLEAAAMDLGSSALLLYVAAIVAFVGFENLQRAAFGLLTYACWIGANLWRGFQCRAHARRIVRATQAGSLQP